MQNTLNKEMRKRKKSTSASTEFELGGPHERSDPFAPPPQQNIGGMARIKISREAQKFWAPPEKICSFWKPICALKTNFPPKPMKIW